MNEEAKKMHPQEGFHSLKFFFFEEKYIVFELQI